MPKKFLDANGVTYLAQLLNNYPNNEVLGAVIDAIGEELDNKVSKTQVATDTSLGLIKLNPDQNIDVNADNQLVVGGRLGQMSNTTGIYSPNTIVPKQVGNGSFLVTEGNNTTLGNKSLSVTTGMNLNLSTSHPAGSTQYTVANTYVNRILCYLAIDGVACLNEANSTNTVSIISITVNGSQVSPSSTDNSTNIIIRTNGSVNPDNATSTIRVYPKQDGFSNLLVGVAGVRNNGGYSIISGQNVYNQSNASAVFGNAQYNAANSSLLAGRQHINTKQNAFLAGMGHDTSFGSTEVAAVGKWSRIDNATAFAVGNGTSNTVRRNAFEVTTDGGIVLRDTNGVRWKIIVNPAGELISTKLS